MEKIELTKEQIARYIEQHGLLCPVCGSDDITGGDTEYESEFTWQVVTCDRCQASWIDVYKLHSIENVQRGKTEEELRDA